MCGRRKSSSNDAGYIFPSQEIIARISSPQCKKGTSLVE
jgi:hypothetical protein